MGIRDLTSVSSQERASWAELWIKSGSLLQRCCLLPAIAVLSERHRGRVNLPVLCFPLYLGGAR